MSGEKMNEPCPECGNTSVYTKENGIVSCADCGHIIFTPASINAVKVV